MNVCKMIMLVLVRLSATWEGHHGSAEIFIGCLECKQCMNGVSLFPNQVRWSGRYNSMAIDCRYCILRIYAGILVIGISFSCTIWIYPISTQPSQLNLGLYIKQQQQQQWLDQSSLRQHQQILYSTCYIVLSTYHDDVYKVMSGYSSVSLHI